MSYKEAKRLFDEEGLKVCSMCKVSKEATSENYAPNIKTYSGLASRCRQCLRDTDAKRRRDNDVPTRRKWLDERYELTENKTCNRCRVEKPHNEEHYHRQNSNRSGFGGVCKGCSIRISTEEEKALRRQKYLENKEIEVQRVIAWRKKNSDKVYAARAKRNGITHDPLTAEKVNVDVLAVRDNYECGLCHEYVDMTIVWPNTMCPSIDHVLPVSKGGLHRYDNTQLAHLKCNMRKGNRV